MASGEFDKDFGYLMPFLDRVAAAANALSDPAAREELESLVSGEKERWLQIHKLLSGAEEQGSGVSDQGSDEPEARTEDATTEEEPKVPLRSGKEANSKPALQFTVGSLRPGNR